MEDMTITKECYIPINKNENSNNDNINANVSYRFVKRGRIKCSKLALNFLSKVHHIMNRVQASLLSVLRIKKNIYIKQASAKKKSK